MPTTLARGGVPTSTGLCRRGPEDRNEETNRSRRDEAAPSADLVDRETGEGGTHRTTERQGRAVPPHGLTTS